MNFNNDKSRCDNINCDCDGGDQNQIVLIYKGEQFRNYLEYHAAKYNILKPNVSIVLRDADPSTFQFSDLIAGTEREASSSSSPQWDGVLLPDHLIGSLSSSLIWDWTEYLKQQQRYKDIDIENDKERNSGTIQYEDVLPFFRSSTTSMPIDGDVLSMYYRKDLFEKYNIKVPKTWEGYRDAAAFFHGKPWGPNNSKLTGSCVARTNGCDTNINAYWASVILSSMTQSLGTSSGFLLDPKTMDPMLGDAMEETLRILAEQHLLGPVEEVEEIIEDECFAGNDNWYGDKNDNIHSRLNEGRCAITYNWGNQLTLKLSDNNRNYENIGVAQTPGSTQAFNRTSGNLETCTPELCPYGIYYDDIGIVNRPSYSAFGGWKGVVSAYASPWAQHALADFFAYISNPEQSLSDILPNDRSNFATPYRYSHFLFSDWMNAGYDETTASEYKDTLQEINSDNTVLEIKSSLGTNVREIIHEEVYSYLLNVTANADLYANSTNKNQIIRPNSTNVMIRKGVTNRIDHRIREQLMSVDESAMTESYRASLNFKNDPGDVFESMNFIDNDIRETGWGLAGVICCAALVLIGWILLNRKNHAMQAFQPFLMIQCATGLFFMGVTLILLGFDDSIFNREILDITCMVTPWVYVFGYTLFFSSVYSKILMCLNIFKHPGKYAVMSVRAWDSFKLCAILLLLNWIILFLWTMLDPMKWVRLEKTEDGMREKKFSADGNVETYGTCAGEKYDHNLFFIALFVFNMACCFIAMIQSFRCRFLVLEYHEMQWLQLSILPIFEAWIIGGPILFLVEENPTIKYIVFVFIITLSTIAIAFSTFAPKEWYLRKNKIMAEKSAIAITPAGLSTKIRVLKHPTVESQKHAVTLQNQLDHYTASNTELAIDIRLLQEKFRLLTEREKLAVVENMFAKEITDSQNSRILSTSHTKSEDSISKSTKPGENVTVVNHDDNEENGTEHEKMTVSVGPTLARSINMAGVESFLTRQKSDSTSDDDSYISHPLGPSWLSDLVPVTGDPCMLTVGNSITQSNLPRRSMHHDEMTNNIDEVSAENRNTCKSREVGTTLSRLDKMVESDLLLELGTEISTIAAQLKQNGHYMESVSDIEIIKEEENNNNFDGLNHLNISGISTATENIDLAKTSASAGEPSNGDAVMSQKIATESSERYSQQQHAGEPSSGERQPQSNKQITRTAIENDGISDNLNSLMPEQYKGPKTPPTECATSSQRSLFSSTSSETNSEMIQSQKNQSYSIADWTAVGTVGSLLADLSDTTSVSSYAESSSSVDSISSMEITTPASNLNVPLTNEIDELLAHSDFDGVKSAAKKYEKGSLVEEYVGNAKMTAYRQKKRDLEANRRFFRPHDT